MKLQRNHGGKDTARNCPAARKARGADLRRNAKRQESGVEVFALNKHKEVGSHNNREVEAGTRRGTAFDHVDAGVVSLTC